MEFIVEDCLVVELKCVERVLPVHRAQLLSYLKLTGHKLGLLLNFNVVHMRNGVHRVINAPASAVPATRKGFADSFQSTAAVNNAGMIASR